jgi:hypothetical protein
MQQVVQMASVEEVTDTPDNEIVCPLCEGSTVSEEGIEFSCFRCGCAWKNLLINR